MFGPVQGKVDKLLRGGMISARMAKVFRAVLGNATQALEHKGPVSITLSAQTAKTPAGSMKSLPSDANKTAAALKVDNFGGRSLHVASGNSTIDGDSHTINAPTTVNNYSYINYPMHVYDDIRMMNELIFKYGVYGRGSTVARIKLLGTFTSGGAQAIIIGPDGSPYGQVITVHLPSGSSGGQNVCASGGTTGHAIYMSDYAGGGPLADCAVRPNIGAWELLSVDAPATDYNTCAWQAVVKVCCINNKLIVCTQTINFSTPVKLGAVDCGGSVMCT